MNRRGFLASLGLATLAVALDVLPALGQHRPTFRAEEKPIEICGYFSFSEVIARPEIFQHRFAESA